MIGAINPQTHPAQQNTTKHSPNSFFIMIFSNAAALCYPTLGILIRMSFPKTNPSQSAIGFQAFGPDFANSGDFGNL